MKGPSSKADPDPALIRRAQSGDRGALRALLEEVSEPVRQWAFAHTADGADAADLAQDVCLLLLKKLPSFRGDSRFLTWLFTVTRNQALEGYRRRMRSEKKMDRFEAEHLTRDRREPEAPTEVDRSRIRGMIRTFVLELPPRQREVFQLSEFQGLSSPEIGRVLELDPGSVRAALFKARRTLRSKILDSHPEFVEEYLP